jgi:hypothetical protein
LSGSLSQLGERLGLPAAHAPGLQRMREVIERDRALVAASPERSVALTAVEAVVSAPPSEVPLVDPSDAVPAAPAPAPASAAERCEAVPEGGEPIRTRTMAKLLARQGYRLRALAIYEHLLARTPDDAALRAEADQLRASER